jgi:hypothetical protein
MSKARLIPKAILVRRTNVATPPVAARPIRTTFNVARTLLRPIAIVVRFFAVLVANETFGQWIAIPAIGRILAAYVAELIRTDQFITAIAIQHTLAAQRTAAARSTDHHS